MEAFHLLSRGGVKFDKQKYRDNVKLFNVSEVNPSHQFDCPCSQVEVEHLERKSLFCAESGGWPSTGRVGFLQVYPGRRTEEKATVRRLWWSEET